MGPDTLISYCPGVHERASSSKEKKALIPKIGYMIFISLLN